MKASNLVLQLQKLIEKFGDLEIAVDVPSEAQVFEVDNLIEWDSFEPGHPGYYLLTTEDEV